MLFRRTDLSFFALIYHRISSESTARIIIGHFFYSASIRADTSMYTFGLSIHKASWIIVKLIKINSTILVICFNLISTLFEKFFSMRTSFAESEDKLSWRRSALWLSADKSGLFGFWNSNELDLDSRQRSGWPFRLESANSACSFCIF